MNKRQYFEKNFSKSKSFYIKHYVKDGFFPENTYEDLIKYLQLTEQEIYELNFLDFVYVTGRWDFEDILDNYTLNFLNYSFKKILLFCNHMFPESMVLRNIYRNLKILLHSQKITVETKAILLDTFRADIDFEIILDDITTQFEI